MPEINFSQKEKEILDFWEKNKIFEKSLKQTKKSDVFNFYDGPPFATGLPHYGHLVAGLMKDVVPRYWTMKGYYVPRVWGWDCHGLPIENLIEQELGLKDKKDIQIFGIQNFNQACRNSVLRYAKEWKKTVQRMGRWVDIDNAYKTMDKDYMESIWWVFKVLWDKGLIYQGYKAMHICPRCQTPLSNFEVTQNYQDIKDLSVITKFELVDQPRTYILAWTTTPWTLPGNVALALGENINYVKVQSGKDKYILAKDNLEKIFEGKEYKILGKVKAKNLEGKKYKPLFDYFVEINKDYKNIYTIQIADFVTVEDGTGVVHIAPGFGEDDMNLGKVKNLPMIKHVNPAGRFTAEVKDWAGELVKPKEDTRATDRKIVTYLKARGLVFKEEEFVHSYPLCWRCDTPLLNYATSSWFVKVTALKKDLIKNNKKINWVPKYLKEGRFGKWLEEAKDWAISRSRYWGTPLPVWRCQTGFSNFQFPISKQDGNQKSCGEIKTVGSIKELEELSGQKVNDLHKHMVDKIEFKCKKCGGVMRRIPEVLDCWFESGSMPYAQEHFPFKTGDDKKKGPKTLPANFIAEGIDQTRGWFYTLLVLSTALFGKSAFLNMIANGIVLAEDGTKMSKRLKNYPEPDEVMEKYGADALRYYLLSSPVMEAETLNFSEIGVKEAMQKVVMLLNNILSFYQLYANSDTNLRITSESTNTNNVLDKWILAKLHLLIKQVTEAMDNYYLVKAVRPIQEFINELSTWWLRRSRERFKGDDEKDKTIALKVLGYTLLNLSKVMAPFTPFIAEVIYQELKILKKSVHLESWPQFDPKLIKKDILDEMEKARKDVEIGLAKRAEAKIKVRQVLNSFTSPTTYKYKETIKLIADELNVLGVKKGKDYQLDTKITQGLKEKGLVRELIRQINNLRKNQGLTIADKIIIYYEGKSFTPLIKKFVQEIKTNTLADEIKEGLKEKRGKEIKVNESKMFLSIDKIE